MHGSLLNLTYQVDLISAQFGLVSPLFPLFSLCLIYFFLLFINYFFIYFILTTLLSPYPDLLELCVGNFEGFCFCGLSFYFPSRSILIAPSQSCPSDHILGWIYGDDMRLSSRDWYDTSWSTIMFGPHLWWCILWCVICGSMEDINPTIFLWKFRWSDNCIRSRTYWSSSLCALQFVTLALPPLVHPLRELCGTTLMCCMLSHISCCLVLWTIFQVSV